MAKPLPISPAVQSQLLDQFPHRSNTDLAREFGLNVRQVQYIGYIHGLNKTAATRSASRRARHADSEPLSLRVDRAVQAAGPHGIDSQGLQAALPGISPSSITCAINKLTADKRAHRRGGKGKSRWFATADLAEAWAQASQAASLRREQARALLAQAPACNTVQIRLPTAPALAPGEPFVPEHIKPLICPPVPGPDARWHTGAAPHFSARKPGTYDADAPASLWAAAITSPARTATP